MTIKPNDNMSKIHRELIEFMQDHMITIPFAAELLKCGEHIIARYRTGHTNFTKERLDTLKRKYKEYIQKKLDSIEV